MVNLVVNGMDNFSNEFRSLIRQTNHNALYCIKLFRMGSLRRCFACKDRISKTKNTILYTAIGAIDSMVHLEMQMPIDSVTHTEDHAILFMDETLKIE